MKKFYFLDLLSFIWLVSCNECPIQEAPTLFLCETRIVTLERFNPNFQIINNKAILDPDYNISVYEFPVNRLSSGSLPNDFRYENRALIPLVSFPFNDNGNIYYANIMDIYPTNTELIGDWLVRDINVATNPPVAYIRIYGSISLFFQGLITENSQQFCDFVEQNKNQIISSLNTFTETNRYGRNQIGAIFNNYNGNNILITNANGLIIGSVGMPNVPIPPADILNKLNQSAQKLTSIDLPIVPGNVYTYIGRNGKRFVVLITEIRQTAIPPNRKRVSIMIYPIDK